MTEKDRVKISRSEATRKKIINAFLALYTAKGIHNFTVNEIIYRADISRSTFYFYYDNINALLEETENEFWDGMRAKGQWMHSFFVGDYAEDGPPPHFLRMLDFLLENKDVFVALMGMNGDPAFAERYKQIVKEDILTILDNNHLSMGKYQEYVLASFVNAVSGLIYYWLSNGARLSPGEVGNLVNTIVWQSPFVNEQVAALKGKKVSALDRDLSRDTQSAV